MPNFSIRSRLIFLSVLLLAILAGSSALLIRELVRNSQSLNEEVEASLDRQERKFGQQAFWRFEILGDQLRRHAAGSVSAKGGPSPRREQTPI